MNAPNDGGARPDNMELLRQKAAECGPGCGCHATPARGRWRWLIGALVLAAAGAVVVRAMTRGDAPSVGATETAFASPAATPVAAPPPTAQSAEAKETGATRGSEEAIVGTGIASMADLNAEAAGTDAVFIFLPGRGGVSGNLPSAPMKGAARIIEGQGYKIGLFTLKAGGRDYDQIASQMPVPGVLAAVKGRGMFPVSGEITETKLVQGFVAASQAGGCGTGGCGPSGCR